MAIFRKQRVRISPGILAAQGDRAIARAGGVPIVGDPHDGHSGQVGRAADRFKESIESQAKTISNRRQRPRRPWNIWLLKWRGLPKKCLDVASITAGPALADRFDIHQVAPVKLNIDTNPELIVVSKIASGARSSETPEL